MMSKDEKLKKEGEGILTNYKKQLAEKMAREKTDKGETMSNRSSKKGGKGSMDDDDERSSKLGQEITGNEPMEPEILL